MSSLSFLIASRISQMGCWKGLRATSTNRYIQKQPQEKPAPLTKGLGKGQPSRTENLFLYNTTLFQPNTKEKLLLSPHSVTGASRKLDFQSHLAAKRQNEVMRGITNWHSTFPAQDSVSGVQRGSERARPHVHACYI